MIRIVAKRLTASAFAEYGQVIETGQATAKWGQATTEWGQAANKSGQATIMTINQGQALRHHDLADLDFGPADGKPCLSIFSAVSVTMPFQLRLLERHPLSSQAFVPLKGARMLIVVAAASSEQPEAIAAFVSDGGQGVNYAPGAWHHPLLVLDRDSDVLVVDRAGPQGNCDEWHPSDPIIVEGDV